MERSNRIVYKYRSEYERDISLLKEGKIYAPTIEKLNDPYGGLFEALLIKQLGIFRHSAKNISS